MVIRHTFANAMHKVRKSEDGEYGILLQHGSMELGFYQPGEADEQTPHDQDELYIVLHGSGKFTLDGDRQPFEEGEALFVPAGAEHRFEDYSDGFCAWVVFYGPAGGEQSLRNSDD